VQTKASQHKITIFLSEPLADGEHKLKAVINYSLIFKRQLVYQWFITVDTKPPNLTLSSQEQNFLVTGKDTLTVNGNTEAGALLEAKLNEKVVYKNLKIKENGLFSLLLKPPERKNMLTLKATDRAGNSRYLTIPVIKDKLAPTVKSLDPGEQQVVRLNPQVTVTFAEEDTGLKSVSLYIDKQLAATKGDDRSLAITYSGGLLSDGLHQAKVVALDYADNKLEKEWQFQVDTRRIVVNKSQRRLYFYQANQLKLVFPVAVGMPAYPTPSGNWRIVRKEINPVWYNPGSDWAKEMPKKIPPGPTNPLGLRALALSAPGVLIHGTSDYASIGRAASHGCVRMRNEDIVKFFPLVGVGVPVQIVN
jgi:lipoprotein-anchoring transpeptidase ErfK/SrfK